MPVMEEQVQEIEHAREAVQRSLDWQDDSAHDRWAAEKADND